MLRLLTNTLCLTLIAAPTLAQDRLAVEFVRVREAPLTFDAALTGTVNATDTIEIGFRHGGRVIEVAVSEGDAVTRGQALARTDPLQSEQALRVAEAAVTSARASQEQARQAQERAAAMLSRGVGTRASLDGANQALSAAEGAMTEAISTRDQARRALEDTTIRAPTDAIVTARRAEPGQIVGAAQSVITLASSTGREVVFQTPDSPLLDQVMGAPVSLVGIDFPDLRMQAKVSDIAPLVDASTGSVLVRARIDDPPPGFELLGSAVRGAVHFPIGRGISVPWTALTATAGSPAVWVVDEGGRVSLAKVGIAGFAEGSVILATGVESGQIVVGAGSQSLYPGREVVEAQISAEVR
ncbi:MAG TPA: efflux RND transporter periplasmic adaptor subunit [Paracoccus sp. (in: a-proteobacteria)]|uniref:efflux RND transporter periplasmic adaptor subunit n=1 Tax=Paracoccus sp. TaxID=267 RepID=UPI002CE4FFE3|nr:efflux RND transporter periplasmic adaptor subunit [Paracoccus sp. (in: a-proteobacteria)]HWL57198.1 efflux RND transporter periplasmic adaptor subunit [Paracoccus sp. (in: a-proteobacteria)]